MRLRAYIRITWPFVGFLQNFYCLQDAIIGLVAFLIGGAKFAVDKGVQNVADVAQRVENKTIAVKNNVANAGGALANTWGTLSGKREPSLDNSLAEPSTATRKITNNDFYNLRKTADNFASEICAFHFYMCFTYY